MRRWIKFGLLLLPVWVVLLCTVQPSTNVASLALPDKIQVDTSYLDTASAISIDDVTLLGLVQNLQIEMRKLERTRARFDVQKERAKYDAELRINADYTKDKKPATNAVQGSREILGQVESGISKRFPTGTKVEIFAAERRTITGSSFASLNDYHRSETGVSLRQPVLENVFGYLDRARDRLAELQAAQLDDAAVDQIEANVLRMRNAYWELAAHYEALLAQQEMVKQARVFLERSHEFLENGLIEENELYGAEAFLRKKVADYLRSTFDLETESNEVKFLLNTPSPYGLKPKSEMTLTAPENISVAASLERAFQMRRDLKQEQAETKIRGLEQKMAGHSLWPALDFVGSFATHGLDREFWESMQANSALNPTYFGGIEFSMPLENRKARAEHAQSKIDTRLAWLALEELHQRIEMEIDFAVRHVFFTYEDAWQRSEVARLEKQKLDEEIRKFNVGRSDSKTLRDFSEQYIEARIRMILALAEHNKAMDLLRRTENTLLDEIGYHA